MSDLLVHNIYKCKNIFTKKFKDVGIEVPKSKHWFCRFCFSV